MGCTFARIIEIGLEPLSIMVSPQIAWIFEKLAAVPEHSLFSEDQGPTIVVNKLAGRAGMFYEKVRYLVDYKEEHTIRRSAIARILNIKLLIERSARVGLPLLQELVSGGYLPNKTVPESLAPEIQKVVDKYLFLGESDVPLSMLGHVMAGEIERMLYPQHINTLVAEAFYATAQQHIQYVGTIDQHEWQTQLFIACRRSLLKDDQDTLRYALLVRAIPELVEGVHTEESLTALRSRFVRTLRAIDEHIEHPLGWRLAGKLRNNAIYFSVLKEIIKRYGVVAEPLCADTERLESEVRKFLGEKYEQQKRVLARGGVRAVVYVLATKIILALLLELPYERFFLPSVDYVALGTNILFHPLLLFGIVQTTKLPPPSNTDLVVRGVLGVVRGDKSERVYIKPQTENMALLAVFGALYAGLFGVSFGLIISILTALHFNIVSIVLFVFFLTFVSYFGFRIRHNAQVWKVYIEKEGILALLGNLLAMPIVRTGRWLSTRFASMNIFVFLLDFILETPFKFVLGTFDSFITFLKEKGEDPYY